MKIRIILFCCIFTFFSASFSLATPSSKSNLSLDEIIRNIENRYDIAGFSANFVQESTIKAMEITDTASGKVTIKRPGMMKWEYETPEKQTIITDGEQLWIYRPEDNQVMIGHSPFFFKDGKGAGFLSDIKVIRQKFDIFLEKKNTTKYHILKMLPKNKDKTFDLSSVYLLISMKTFEIVQIITYNSYDDATRIKLNDIEFKRDIDNSVFNFKIPKGVDILQLDEQ